MKNVLIFSVFFLSLVCLKAQTVVKQIYIENELRSYRLFIPENLQGTQNLPLVLNFHGYGSNAAQQQVYTDMNSTAEDNNFIVVYPQGLENSYGDNAWDVGFLNESATDIPFVEKIIDQMFFEYAIDVSKVYSCGMSNGGFFSYRLACEIPERIAAIASVTGSMLLSEIDDCTATTQMPILQIHGTADSTVLYEGDQSSSSIENLVNFWALKNECDTTKIITAVDDIITTDNCTAEIIEFTNCNKQTILYKIDGGGHTWPSSLFDIGITNRDFNANNEIWNFFNTYEIENPIIPITTSIVNNELPNLTFINNSQNNSVKILCNLVISEIEILNLSGQSLKRITNINEQNFNYRLTNFKNQILLFKVKIGENYHTKKVLIY